MAGDGCLSVLTRSGQAAPGEQHRPHDALPRDACRSRAATQASIIASIATGAGRARPLPAARGTVRLNLRGDAMRVTRQRPSLRAKNGKRSFPLSKVYQLLEPGPVVLLTTAGTARPNAMPMSWHTMMEFEPPLVGCVVSNRNHSFRALLATRECVIDRRSRNQGCRMRKYLRAQGRQVRAIRPHPGARCTGRGATP